MTCDHVQLLLHAEQSSFEGSVTTALTAFWYQSFTQLFKR